MKLIQPFPGLRPTPETVAGVIAPPYDVLDRAEAKERAKNKPFSFLHISKPEIDLPIEVDPYALEVYDQGRENLFKLRQDGVLRQDPASYYYVYRLQMGNHVQTGLVAGVAVEAYQKNHVHKHEQTRPVKVTDRMEHIKALRAQTGPVLLAYRHRAEIDALFDKVTQAVPEVDVVADDIIKHQLWVIKEPELIEQFTQAVDAVGDLYIADGHHRSEAAAQYAMLPENKNNPACQYFLAVIFPDNQLQIMGYHRVVKDLHGYTQEQFLQALSKTFQIQAIAKPIDPSAPGEFTMYLPGQWYTLKTLPEKINPQNKSATLDVNILADNVLQPLLGINDPRRDPRIDFIGGMRGLSELRRRVDNGEMAVAFALYPTQITSIMAIADANQNMPPKSTWFEPKLADGLVSRLL